MSDLILPGVVEYVAVFLRGPMAGLERPSQNPPPPIIGFPVNPEQRLREEDNPERTARHLYRLAGQDFLPKQNKGRHIYVYRGTATGV